MLFDAQKLSTLSTIQNLPAKTKVELLAYVLWLSPLRTTISRIHSVDLFCLTSSSFNSLSTNPAISVADDLDSAGYNDSPQVQRHPMQTQGAFEHPAASIRKILGNSHFYYSSYFDISSRLVTRVSKGNVAGGTFSYNPHFLWNSFLVDSLLGFRNELPPPARQSFDQST